MTGYCNKCGEQVCDCATDDACRNAFEAWHEEIYGVPYSDFKVAHVSRWHGFQAAWNARQPDGDAPKEGDLIHDATGVCGEPDRLYAVVEPSPPLTPEQRKELVEIGADAVEGGAVWFPNNGNSRKTMVKEIITALEQRCVITWRVEPRIADGFYPHHACSLCGTNVGYYVENGDVFYDSNCDCAVMPSAPQPRSQAELQQFLDSRQP